MKILPIRNKKYFTVFALTVCMIFAVGVQRAAAGPPQDLLSYILDALDSISESVDNVHVDTWSGPEGYNDTILDGWARTVPAMEGKYFELNASIVCSFASNGSDINFARISFRRSDSDPFLVSFEAQSTENVVELYTGPVVGYQSNASYVYVVQCSPTGTSTFSTVVTTVKFEALPDPDTGNSFD